MSNTTNVASTCESLFNDVEDLGSGVAAIGQLLRFGQHEAYPDVLNGIGVVLHHLGKTMSGLNEKFMEGGTYRNIRALEIKEAEALVSQQLQQDKAEDMAVIKELLSMARSKPQSEDITSPISTLEN